MEQNNQDRYKMVIGESHVTTDDAFVAADVKAILDKHFDENNNVEVYKRCFNAIDLTTLNSTDTVSSVTKFVTRVNDFETEYPELPNVAAICVYPNFAMVVSGALEVSGVQKAVVAGSFPSSQTFLEIKTTEAALAVADGATEVDIVFNLGLYYDGQYEELADEISEIKHSVRDAHLKVILETGALKTALDIRNAAILSMYSGADFIKTSTGKVYPGATLEAAYVMLHAIKEYYEKTGRKVGFKVSGGVSSTDDAVRYYTLVREILGEEWLTNELFRIGTSRAANYILSSIVGKEVKFFQGATDCRKQWNPGRLVPVGIFFAHGGSRVCIRDGCDRGGSDAFLPLRRRISRLRRQKPSEAVKTALERDAFAESFFSVINKQRGCVFLNAASLLLCRVS